VKACSAFNVQAFITAHSIEAVDGLLATQDYQEQTVMDDISEDSYDKNIAEKCTAFVANLRPEAARYIATDRLQLKANLTSMWAIQSQEKAFDFIDAQIKSVQWEKYETLNQCFSMLKNI